MVWFARTNTTTSKGNTLNPINRKTGEAVKVRKVRSDKFNSKGRNKRAQYSRRPRHMAQNACEAPSWESYDAA